MLRTCYHFHGDSCMKVKELTYIALFSGLMAICSWLSIPASVPFTLQTFAVFAALCILGGKRGTCSIAVYILLGAVGLPVFAGFNGGIGVILGATGGYIAGFLFSGVAYWLITHFLGSGRWVKLLAVFIGLILCYAFGTVWYVQVYAGEQGGLGFIAALTRCVVPFIIPDVIKLLLAVYISEKIKKHVRLNES